MDQVWRIHLIPNTGVNVDIGEYCINNHIAGMGWSLRDSNSSERMAIGNDFNQFEKLAKVEYPDKAGFSPVKRFYYEVEDNDLLWTRVNGKYYIARIKLESRWSFVADKDTTDMDLSNQLSNIEWYQVSDCADESSVPGAITTAFIKGSTFQRIRKSGINEYSQMLYNHLTKDDFRYDVGKIELNSRNFFNLLQPHDLEDILCVYLYDKNGYLCIPSTNKIATALYECVMIDPTVLGKNIYIQVKKGEVDINEKDYVHLQGEIYFLTTEGNILNHNPQNPQIHIVNPEDIFTFCIDPTKQNILPEKIRTWVGLLGAKRGIIIDTNKTYSQNNEIEMLTQNKVAAYGDAKEYMKRFHKDDYAFFYSKGLGIVAIGRVLEDVALNNGDAELYHNVEMLVPSQYDFANKPLKALSTSEIHAILNHGFYYASTMKVPFLDDFEVQTLRKELQKKYS